MPSRHLTLTIHASRASVFNLLADIENFPTWSGGFCEWIELHCDGWWAYTSLGEFVVESMVDDIAGAIDLRLRHVSGWMILLPLRVRTDGAGGSIVNLTCRQVSGMTDDDYERLFDSLLMGLRRLSDRVQPELAVA
jgi:hypothetical protein